MRLPLSIITERSGIEECYGYLELSKAYFGYDRRMRQHYQQLKAGKITDKEYNMLIEELKLVRKETGKIMDIQKGEWKKEIEIGKKYNEGMQEWENYSTGLKSKSLEKQSKEHSENSKKTSQKKSESTKQSKT